MESHLLIWSLPMLKDIHFLLSFCHSHDGVISCNTKQTPFELMFPSGSSCNAVMMIILFQRENDGEHCVAKYQNQATHVCVSFPPLGLPPFQDLCGPLT